MTTPRRYTVQEALDLGLDEVLDLNRKYVNETLVDVISSYGLPRKFVAAEGIRLWDDRGRENLDFLCSYGALGLGHNNPDVIKAVKMARRPPNSFVIAPGALTGAFRPLLSPTGGRSGTRHRDGGPRPTELAPTAQPVSHRPTGACNTTLITAYDTPAGYGRSGASCSAHELAAEVGSWIVRRGVSLWIERTEGDTECPRKRSY